MILTGYVPEILAQDARKSGVGGTVKAPALGTVAMTEIINFAVNLKLNASALTMSVHHADSPSSISSSRHSLTFISIAAKPPISGYFPGEMAGGVGDRDVKSRMKLTICAQATGRTGGFENQHLLTTLREVCGTDQPVVSCADND